MTPTPNRVGVLASRGYVDAYAVIMQADDGSRERPNTSLLRRAGLEHNRPVVLEECKRRCSAISAVLEE